MLLGSQEPRVRCCPSYSYTSGPDAVAIYQSTGRELDPWQKSSLDDHCAENADGTWLTIESVEEVSRQNGKGEIINALILLHMFVLGTKMTIYSAHEFKTAKESYLKIYEIIRNTPKLHKKVAYYHNSNEDTSIGLKSGQRLRFLTRSKDGGRGFTGDAIIFDEAFNIASAALAAILPTLSSKANPHIYFFSSAGKASEESDVLRGYKERGEAGDQELVYRSFSAPPGADIDDDNAVAMANPALGRRITMRYVNIERKAMRKKPQDFRRERLGIWDLPSKVEPVFPTKVWKDAEALPGQRAITSKLVVAIDRRTGMEQSVAIAVAGDTEYGFPLVDMALYERGADEQWSEDFVFEEAVEILGARGLNTIALDDHGENEKLILRFRDAGYTVLALNTRDMANGAVDYFDAFKNGRAKHGDDEDLNDAVAGAAKRKYGDSLWLWSQEKSTVDITCLRAATVAWWVYSSGLSGDYDLDNSTF